jgi:uncharacterized protein (TIGR02466 family)
MASKLESVFPTYLYRGSFASTTVFNRELAREIAALESIDTHGVRWSRENYIGGYSSYSSLCHLHQTSPNFAELERRLAPHVRKFVRRLNWDLLGREVRMTTCWVNAMGNGTHHTLHLHPASVLSGVYYVDAPKGSSPLKIEDPRMGLLMASPPRKTSAPEQEQNYLLLPPKAGHFVLFESWMRHEVPPHRGSRRRLSVSFNFEWI